MKVSLPYDCGSSVYFANVPIPDVHVACGKGCIFPRGFRGLMHMGGTSHRQALAQVAIVSGVRKREALL